MIFLGFLVLCIATSLESRKIESRIKVGSGVITGHGWFDSEGEFVYNIPSEALRVSLNYKKAMSSKKGKNGEVTLTWKRGNKTAKVTAKANGSGGWSWSGMGKKMSWNVWASSGEKWA